MCESRGNHKSKTYNIHPLTKREKNPNINLIMKSQEKRTKEEGTNNIYKNNLKKRAKLQ